MLVPSFCSKRLRSATSGRGLITAAAGTGNQRARPAARADVHGVSDAMKEAYATVIQSAP